MGVDLRLLVVEHKSGNWGFSHSMFEFGRCYDLYPKLDKAARTLPGFTLSSFSGHDPSGKWEDHCYGDTKETPYGKPLTYVTAGEFLKAVRDLPGSYQLWPRARAAIAYLKELDPDTFVALYYH